MMVKFKIIIGLLLIASVFCLSSCKKKIKGCTNFDATNYNSSATQDDGSCTLPPSALGQSFGGGLVFYIDGTAKHGLVVALSDQSASCKWNNGSYIVTNAKDSIVGSGQANTNAIVSKQGAGSYAAKICDDLSSGGFSDWFLPSRGELDLVYKNIYTPGLGAFTANAYYWSSTEYDNNNAWTVRFASASFFNPYDKVSVYRVRAVRAF